jgi:uncharacterized membrane-anchored protein
MNNKKLLLTALVIAALAQLYFPAKMIINKETVLNTGKEFKFRTAPIDPNDPLRGKYITLVFKENTFDVHRDSNWASNESVFVILTTDEQGFAKIKSVSKEKPTDDQDFIKGKVTYVSYNGNHRLFIEYPFNRFYMEESKAYDAERLYRRSLPDTSQKVYALVNIKDGDAVLKDVRINDISIREIVSKEQKNKN